MRALNTIGIIGSIVIFWYGTSVVKEIEQLVYERYKYYNGFGRLDAGIENLFLNGAFFMIIVGLFYVGLYGGNLKQIKRKTVKIISILGIIFASIFVLMNIVFVGSGNVEDFAMAYVMWWLFGLVSLAFTIVLLVQAVRDVRGVVRSVTNYGDDIIDDFELE
ncbi:MAG: hypothetical protein P8I55_09330 [Crocinitomix sp.]|nr:hypothetical protein [Crocinitomix sp.]